LGGAFGVVLDLDVGINDNRATRIGHDPVNPPEVVVCAIERLEMSIRSRRPRRTKATCLWRRAWTAHLSEDVIEQEY
jgi:hypothetical protein